MVLAFCCGFARCEASARWSGFWTVRGFEIYFRSNLAKDFYRATGRNMGSGMFTLWFAAGPSHQSLKGFLDSSSTPGSLRRFGGSSARQGIFRHVGNLFLSCDVSFLSAKRGSDPR